MHARKTARDALFPSREDDGSFFAPRRGDIVFRTTTALRAFADRVNRAERRADQSELRPAELAAMALVHEVLHAVVDRYRERYPQSFQRFSTTLDASLGPETKKVAVDFLAVFPPPAVYQALRGEGDDFPATYLERMTLSASGRAAEVEIDEELILLWVM